MAKHAWEGGVRAGMRLRVIGGVLLWFVTAMSIASPVPAAVSSALTPGAQTSMGPDSITMDDDTSMHLVYKFVLAMTFVGVVAGLGWWLVVATRNGGGVAMLRRQAADPMFRLNLLSHRRISPRLQIVAVEVAPGTAVVFADNGNAIVKLYEAPAQDFSKLVDRS